MSKTMLALLLPFLNFKFSFGDEGGGPTVIDLEPQAAQVAELEKTPPVAENAEPSNDEPGKPSDDNKADKTFTQAELDEIVQKRISKLERKALKERTELETRLQIQQESKEKPEPAADKPKVEDYADYNEYIEDLTDWKTDQKIKAVKDSENQAKIQESQQSEQERKSERQADIIEKGSAKYDDFEDMPGKTAAHLKSKGLAFTTAMVETLTETENAPDIVHYLYVNLAEAERIAALPAYAQAKEIGKLEDKLLAKAPVKASNAPKPIEPIGSNSGSSKSLEEMSPEEYIEARRKQKPKWA